MEIITIHLKDEKWIALLANSRLIIIKLHKPNDYKFCLS